MTIDRMVELLKIEHECILRNTHGDCDRQCEACDLVQDDGDLHEMYENVIGLVESMEPRVMTLEEAKSASGYVFVQSRNCNILELQLIKDGFVYDSFAVPIAVDVLWWEGYNKYWRLWTSSPTDEQMEAVKWDAQEQRDYEAAVEMAEYCKRYEPTYNADDGSM